MMEGQADRAVSDNWESNDQRPRGRENGFSPLRRAAVVFGGAPRTLIPETFLMQGVSLRSQEKPAPGKALDAATKARAHW